jgi:hypothetical protein
LQFAIRILGVHLLALRDRQRLVFKIRSGQPAATVT